MTKRVPFRPRLTVELEDGVRELASIEYGGAQKLCLRYIAEGIERDKAAMDAKGDDGEYEEIVMSAFEKMPVTIRAFANHYGLEVMVVLGELLEITGGQYLHETNHITEDDVWPLYSALFGPNWRKKINVYNSAKKALLVSRAENAPAPDSTELTVKELAQSLSVPMGDVIKFMFRRGTPVTPSQVLDKETAKEIVTAMSTTSLYKASRKKK